MDICGSHYDVNGDVFLRDDLSDWLKQQQTETWLETRTVARLQIISVTHFQLDAAEQPSASLNMKRRPLFTCTARPLNKPTIIKFKVSKTLRRDPDTDRDLW